MAPGDTAVSQDVTARPGPLGSTRGCSLHVRFGCGAWGRAVPGAGPAGREMLPVNSIYCCCCQPNPATRRGAAALRGPVSN